MTIPKFPRHLSPEERQAVLERAARAFMEEKMAEVAAKTGANATTMKEKMGADRAENLLLGAIATVAHRWQNERIDQLEAEVRAGHERIKMLEARHDL